MSKGTALFIGNCHCLLKLYGQATHYFLSVSLGLVSCFTVCSLSIVVHDNITVLMPIMHIFCMFFGVTC